MADLTGQDIDSVMVRVTPYDTEAGQPDTLKVHIDNNAVPGLNGNNTSGTARDITLNFTLTDTENDVSVSATAIVNGEHIYLPLVLRQH